MKLTRTQLKEIIKKEVQSLNESVDLDKIADLYAYYGMDSSRWDAKTVGRYGEDVVDGAKMLLPHMRQFEKNVVNLLKKIRNDKMYPIYLEMINASDGYQGGKGYTSFGDMIGYIAYRNGVK